MSAAMFEKSATGQIVIKRLAEAGTVLPKNFRFFSLGWIEKGKPSEWNTMKIEGAEFRAAKTGPRKGQLVIELKGTRRDFYVTKEEIREYDRQQVEARKAKQARAVAKGTVIPLETTLDASHQLTYGEFTDDKGTECLISDTGTSPESRLFLSVKSSAEALCLSQANAKALIPLLEHFVAKGVLPAPKIA